MPLPHFLLLICIVLVAAALTLWLAFSAGVPVPLIGLAVVLAAGFVRMMTRVE